jgi:SET domain-containing protein
MLIVKKSRLPDAGKGLFTTEKIKKGTLIVEYLGEKLSWKAAQYRYRKSETMAYVFYISDKNCIDAQNTPDELARYANDAKATLGKKVKNNAEYQIVKRKAFIVATKTIAPGEEILVDYGDDYWENEEEETVKKKKKKSKSKNIKKFTKEKKTSKKKTKKKSKK